jgi:hypothetical protein
VKRKLAVIISLFLVVITINALGEIEFEYKYEKENL